jgi:hypothetical protein
MNKAEEQRLATLAKTAFNLRETIDKADAMMRSWSRHRKEPGRSESGEIYLSLSDRRVSTWHTGVNLPAEVVQAELVPVLKRIRDTAATQLLALSATDLRGTRKITCKVVPTTRY